MMPASCEDGSMSVVLSPGRFAFHPQGNWPLSEANFSCHNWRQVNQHLESVARGIPFKGPTVHSVQHSKLLPLRPLSCPGL